MAVFPHMNSFCPLCLSRIFKCSNGLSATCTGWNTSMFHTSHNTNGGLNCLKRKKVKKNPVVINTNLHCLENCLSSWESLLHKVDDLPKLSCLPQVNTRTAEAWFLQMMNNFRIPNKEAKSITVLQTLYCCHIILKITDGHYAHTKKDLCIIKPRTMLRLFKLDITESLVIFTIQEIIAILAQ